MEHAPTIPEYTTDRSLDIGKSNLKKLKERKGKLLFTGVFIHLSPICNFNCKGCFTAQERKSNPNGKRLNFEQIKQIVNFAKDREAKIVIFAGAGEPLLDPEFNKICDYIKEQGLETLLFTNCAFIKDNKKAKQLLLNGPVIGKLITTNQKKYDKIAGMKGAFKKTMKGLNLLIQEKDKLERENKKVRLGIDTFISQQNKDDLENVLRFCRRNNILPYFETFIEINQPKRLLEKAVLSERELANLFLELKKIDKKEFSIDTEIKPWSRTYGQDPCVKATYMFAVKNSGDVFTCICSLKSIGNIFNAKKIYESLERMFNVKNKNLLEYFKCDVCSARINPKFLRC